MKRQSAPATRAARSKAATPPKPAKRSPAKAPARAANLTRKPVPAKPVPAKPAAPGLYSSLHALLHTMRLIEQHEEPLCIMHDELRRTGRLTAPQRRRLQQLLAELPADDYQRDLDTLREAAAA